MQQLAVMFKCGSSNDTVVGLADVDALLSQLAINISCTDEYSREHWQHNQRSKVAPDTPVGGVIRNTLENLRQDDATQGEVFVIEDELFELGHMWQITPGEEIDPDTGVDQNH
mgnify:CR=1 FL=1